jgi:hypothetical protein
MGWAWGRRRRVWYTPEATREYARTVTIYALQARGDWEDAHGRRWPRDGVGYILRAEVRLKGRRRPDVDNILKEVADALRGVLWEDDRDISDARVLALTAPDDAEEALEVTVHALGQV